MRVYCVANDPVILKLRQLVLESAGFTVFGGSGVQAVSELPTVQVDVVVLSADVDPKDRGALKAVLRHGFPVIELERFTRPEDLINGVSQYASCGH